jgi:outer membrane protein OmpA-like peptidoglycan-associated protein
MKSCHLFVALVAAFLVAAPLSAQRPGSVELGAYGAYPIWDNALEWENKVGFGGLLGLFIAPNVSLEADVSGFKPTATFTLPHYSVSVTPMRGRLTFHIPIGGYSRLMLGGGYVRTRVGAPVNTSENGIAGLAGLKIGMGQHLILRLDGTLDYHAAALNRDATANDWNYGVRAGLSLLFGRYRSRDQDKDGVSDRLDRCPNTPRGEGVDSNGCPDRDKDLVRDNVDACLNTPAGDRVDAKGCTIKDSDGDGVLDDVDQCSNTPAGQRVNTSGCPLVHDSDNDGVSDDKDRCADTPAGIAVDASGCPIDSDGDGVIDASDQCANTPRGETVDGTGCPIRDSDGDGIADKLDRCPNTPSGVVVGSDGCVIVFVEGKKNVVLQGVTFVVGRAELTLNAKKILDLVAQSLNTSTEVTFEIQGHASSDGSDVYNLRLSDRRAASVRAYLISKGVDASRMTSKGYGETMPIADNATLEGRNQNRRVELVRTDK